MQGRLRRLPCLTMASAPDASSLFGAVHEDIEYELKIKDVKDALLRVASFTAVENLSVPFSYTLVVASDPDSDAIASIEQALGRDGSFAIKKDGKVARIVHGIVTRVMPDGTFLGKTQAAVAIVLEPRLANLRYSGGFRIFQDMAIHEIVGAIFQPEQIDVLWHVHGTPPKREYTTQFDESDLAFVTRIASEEGLHYFFEHTQEKTTVIFSSEDGYEEIEKKLTLAFHDDIGAVHGEHVRSIRRAQSIRTGAFEYRDYNFLKPKQALVARAETQGKETTANSHKREVRDYPGRFIDKDGAGKSLAQMRLDELRSDAFVFHGTALSLRFAAGYTFEMDGHREDGFNRKYLLTSVNLEGSLQGALRDGGGFRATVKLVTFKAVPAETPIHPKRRPKPLSRLQTARVVGPKDGDPYVDEQGRVKVQFFWDRDGKFDEKSSCWIRMMTPVAHLDEGFWQAHKVGSEVIVGFIDDDIDRPMILGAVYNTSQAHLYLLPDQVAKSVWRTNSIPGNKGFNEITQINTSGAEEIYIHAQKDRRTQVLNNHNETVGANQTVSVGANQTISVGANQTINVGANRTDTVGANETIHIVGNRTENVDKKETVTVKADRTHTISEGKESLTVAQGTRDVKVPSAADTLEAKSKKDTIATTYEIEVGASMTIHHGGDATLFMEAGKASLKTSAEIEHSNPSGSVILKDKKVAIVATDQLVLACGNASIVLSKDGKISISGATEVGIGCQSSTVKLEPAQATLNGAAVTASASGMMQISGALIKIN